MKIFLILSLAFPLFAEDNLDKILTAGKEKLLESMEQKEMFSPQKIVSPQKIEASKVVIEEEQEEDSSLLEIHTPTLEGNSSLEGYIEQETASLLQNTEREENFEKPHPKIEDLSLLANQPKVTQIPEPEVEIKEKNAYETLPITSEEVQKISEILITMAENNVFQLLFQKKHLERLGHEIHHVHPIRFMGTVFSNNQLVICMRRIRRSSFKWDGFMDGFVERIEQEAKVGNLNPYIPGLAKTLGFQTQDIQSYVDRKDFEGLIIFFVENSKT